MFLQFNKKKGKIDDNGEKLEGHINDKEYLMCKKIWDEFDRKNMGDYHDHCLKKDALLLADKILWVKFLSLSWFSWIELGYDVKNDQCKIRTNI